MITFDEAMSALDMPAIARLKTTTLGKSDVINLILQRSEIIRDQPRFNRYVKLWTKGDTAPISDLVDRMGMDNLVRRAAAFIYLEYLQLRPILDAKRPAFIADIGCGYAFFDLFLSQDYDCSVHLIDLESNEHRHFGFEPEGAAYSSLPKAKQLLTDNGISGDRITLLNPKVDHVDALRDIDFAFSFISCGFHYPWQTYANFFKHSVAADGRIILDLRNRILGETKEALSEIGLVEQIGKAANNGADRIMIKKGSAA